MTIDVNVLSVFINTMHETYAEIEAITHELYTWKCVRIKSTIRSSIFCLLRELYRMKMRCALDALMNKAYECNGSTTRIDNTLILGYNYNENSCILIHDPHGRHHRHPLGTNDTFFIWDVRGKRKVLETPVIPLRVGDINAIGASERKMVCGAYKKIITNANAMIDDIDNVYLCASTSSKRVKRKLQLKIEKIKQIAITIVALSKAAISIFSDV